MEPAQSSFLDRFDREPDATKLKLVREFIDNNPLSFFEELRATRPVLVTPECTLVARYDDVVEILNLPNIFTVALYAPKMSNNYLMMHDDNPLHYREKSIMKGLLNRDDLPRIRSMVAETASSILNKAPGRIDAVDQYCRLVPATIVRDYFGLIGIHRKELMEWSYWAQVDTFYNQPFDIITPEERKHIIKKHTETGEKLGKYIAALVLTKVVATKLEFLVRPFRWLKHLITKRHGGSSTDDIVSRMMRAKLPPEMDFNLERVGVNAGGLLIGAIETTAQATVQVIQFLLQRPGLLAQAKNAARQDSPAQFDSIVWEALRFVPISPFMFRQSSREYTIAKGTDRETTIPASTIVLVLTQSAMFDEKAFDNPAEFKAGRDWYHYFTFGYGVHECLGKYVGMVMIPEIVRQVMLRPNLEAKADIVYDGHLPKSYTLAWQT